MSTKTETKTKRCGLTYDKAARIVARTEDHTRLACLLIQGIAATGYDEKLAIANEIRRMLGLPPDRGKE